MCGIFGIISKNLDKYNKDFIYSDLEKMIVNLIKILKNFFLIIFQK